MYYPLALAWSAFVLFSLFGWGFLVHSLLEKDQKSKLIPSLILGMGIAFLISLGGLLNLFSLISIRLNLAILLIGSISFAWTLKKQGLQIEPPSYSEIWTLIISFILLTTRYFHPFINAHDDFHGYLNFILQALANGSMQFLQFNERAVFTLGGGQIFQTFFVMFFDPIMAWQSEAIGGLLILLGLLPSKKNKQTFFIFLCVSFLIVFTPHPNANSTPVLLAGGLLLTILKVLFNGPLEKKKNIALLSFSASSLISLKLPYIAILALILPIRILTPLHKWKINIKSTSPYFIIFLTLLTLAPWMIFSKKQYGTFLFPYFGRGFHISAFTDFPRSAWDFQTISIDHAVMQSLWSPCYILFGLIFLGLIWRKINGETALFPFYFTLLFIAGVAIKILLILVTGTAGARYSYPIDLGLIAFFVFHLLENSSSISRLFHPIFVLICVFWFSLFNPFTQKPKFQTGFRNDAGTLMFAKSTAKTDLGKYYAEAQNQIPEDEQVFVFAEEPINLNYKRNPLHICDAGADLSPPPGLFPVKSKEEFIQYFKNLNIHYIIYSKNGGNYPREAYAIRLQEQDMLIRGVTRSIFLLQDQLNLLVDTHLFFENSHLYVFRL